LLGGSKSIHLWGDKKREGVDFGGKEFVRPHSLEKKVLGKKANGQGAEPRGAPPEGRRGKPAGYCLRVTILEGGKGTGKGRTNHLRKRPTKDRT